MPAGHRVQRRRAQGLAGTQAETGMMPGASHGIADEETLRERPPVMGARRTDGEDLIAPTSEKHRLGADMPGDHAAVSKVGTRNALRQIGATRLLLLFSHKDLHDLDTRPRLISDHAQSLNIHWSDRTGRKESLMPWRPVGLDGKAGRHGIILSL